MDREPVAEHLTRLYGAEVACHLLKEAGSDPLEAPRPLIAAQAAHAVTREGARRLSDVVFRRTGVGYFGPLPGATLEALAATMAPLLGWSAQTVAAEIGALQAHYAGAVP